MRLTSTAAVLLAALTAPAGAGTFIPVPAVPGSTRTFINSINDQNVIVGDYEDDGGVLHAFYGTLDGHYTTFDFDAANLPGTTARDIDNAGNIVGLANQQQGDILHLVEYERFADGTMRAIADHGAEIHGDVGGLSPHGVFTAENWHQDLTADGFLGKNAKVKTQIDLGFAVKRLRPREATDSGHVVGYFTPIAGGTVQGFLLHDGTTDVINYPDQQAVNGTLLEGINSKGNISGYWQDADFNQFWFVYDKSEGSFGSVRMPDYPNTTAGGINKAGFVAVQAYSADFTVTAPFVFCRKRPPKCPAPGFEVADPKPIFAPVGARHRPLSR